MAPTKIEKCNHVWELREPEELKGTGHYMAFCKKCGYLRDSPTKPIASEKTVEPGNIKNVLSTYPGETASKLAIDFNAIANASEFRRFVYWIRTGQVFRGSNEKLTVELNKTQEELDIVKLMKKQQKPIFMGVMNEYKNKLAKIKEKRVE